MLSVSHFDESHVEEVIDELAFVQKTHDIDDDKEDNDEDLAFAEMSDKDALILSEEAQDERERSHRLSQVSQDMMRTSVCLLSRDSYKGSQTS